MLSFEIASSSPPNLEEKTLRSTRLLTPWLRFWQVNFKVKRSNWDGTGDEEKDAEEKKQDEEVL